MVTAQNNLGASSSPYLRQHADNPIWWQEWSADVLEHARRENKPLFVSVGYATCHWCHVMAAESFVDQGVADFLNKHFVSIKVDREQRPDIDQYLMAFIASQGSHGGWPLNCFLTPDLKPFLALTYIPLQPRYGMPGFLDLLGKVHAHYLSAGGQIGPFTVEMDEGAEDSEINALRAFRGSFDSQYGGFGDGTKFPPHCTLLFMLYDLAASGDTNMKGMIEQTLESILRGGLHDHLQGGFYRYCVDREWTIPHFEKMIYDQAMLLWVFSLAFRVIGREEYRVAVVNVLKCLEETFEEGGLYYSGHDADTHHEEGATYVWSRDELARVLTPDEYARFIGVYQITAEGNFEGKNHLLRVGDADISDIENKLLGLRNKRSQPSVDKKIITSWNCLVGIGLIHAYRYAGVTGALEKAETLAQGLMDKHFIDGKLAHSSFDGTLQKQAFLQDYAGLLLLLTYLHEETGRYDAEMRDFSQKIAAFRRDGGWIESFNDDFMPVPAASFDHPVPSSIALAEFALLRVEVLAGREPAARPYRTPLHHDFFNLAGLAGNGLFHIIEAPAKIGWEHLPPNSIQRRGGRSVDCFRGACRELKV
ncbi:MAG: thioredoxin domain-containing protein [Candidatus Omnitrophota bacterium]